MTVKEHLVKLFLSVPPVPLIVGQRGGKQYFVAEHYADHLIAHGVTVQEWIPVTERLPQEDLPVGALCEVVQVLLDDGSVTIGWCNRGLRCWFHMPVRETKMVGHDYENTPVIAWQPLSQPPKGEQHDT